MRLNKHTFANPLHHILPNMTPKIAINNAVPAKTKLQFGLRFLALGSLCRLNTDLYSIGNLTNSPNDKWTANQLASVQLDCKRNGPQEKWTDCLVDCMTNGPQLDLIRFCYRRRAETCRTASEGSYDTWH